MGQIKTIAIDVDGVLADLVPEWLRRYNKDFGDNLTSKDINAWDMSTLVIPRAKETFHNYLYDPDIYDYVQPIAGALEGVNYLREELNMQVTFATTCFFGTEKAKIMWLVKHGFMRPEKHIYPEFVSIVDKSVLGTDVMVDDRDKTIDRYIKEGRRRNSLAIGILYDQPWNQEYPAAMRAKNWKQVISVLDQYVRPWQALGKIR